MHVGGATIAAMAARALDAPLRAVTRPDWLTINDHSGNRRLHTPAASYGTIARAAPLTSFRKAAR